MDARTFMDTYGRLDARTLMDVHGRSWAFSDIHGRTRTFVDVLGRSRRSRTLAKCCHGTVTRRSRSRFQKIRNTVIKVSELNSDPRTQEVTRDRPKFNIFLCHSSFWAENKEALQSALYLVYFELLYNTV